MRRCYVYILGDACRTSLTSGFTTDLKQLIKEYKTKSAQNSKNQKEVLYYETFMNLNQALKREKQLRNWKPGWKITLIKRLNPELRGLQA